MCRSLEEPRRPRRRLFIDKDRFLLFLMAKLLLGRRERRRKTHRERKRKKGGISSGPPPPLCPLISRPRPVSDLWVFLPLSLFFFTPAPFCGWLEVGRRRGEPAATALRRSRIVWVSDGSSPLFASTSLKVSSTHLVRVFVFLGTHF